MLLNNADGLCRCLLISGDTDVTTGLSSTSCLHLAARNGHAAVVRFALCALSYILISYRPVKTPGIMHP